MWCYAGTGTGIGTESMDGLRACGTQRRAAEGSGGQRRAAEGSGRKAKHHNAVASKYPSARQSTHLDGCDSVGDEALEEVSENVDRIHSRAHDGTSLLRLVRPLGDFPGLLTVDPHLPPHACPSNQPIEEGNQAEPTTQSSHTQTQMPVNTYAWALRGLLVNPVPSQPSSSRKSHTSQPRKLSLPQAGRQAGRQACMHENNNAR